MTKASRIKHFILEKEHRRANRVGKRPHLVSIIDNDYPVEATNLLEEQLIDVMEAEILKGKHYVQL